MDKYFETLDAAAFRMMFEPDNDKAMKLYRQALAREHDAGPEANYIIRVWKEERGLKKRLIVSGDVTKPRP